MNKIMGNLRRGFTIVELLIVVVVIAILAAITIVAYNGIQNRAKASATQSAASQAAKKILSYAVDNAESYPDASGTNGISNLTSLGIANSGATTYQYSANNSSSPRTFCITATTQNISYYQNNSTATKPTLGACPGHGVNGVAAITNLILNPSLEGNNANFWSGANGSTVVPDNARAQSGTYSARITMPIANANNVGSAVYNVASLGLTDRIQPNTTYAVSAYVYVPTGSPDVYISIQGTGATGLSTNTPVTVKDSWTRVSRTFTTAASGNVVIYLLNVTSTTASVQFWADAVQLVEGSAIPTYADGNSAGWAWNGTANNATSSGPPL